MKLPLRRPTSMRHVSAYWTDAAPFVENKRAELIHRPAFVAVYNLHQYPHIAVHYLCGNGSTGAKNFTFLDDMPSGRLLCGRCEEAATKLGMPSAYDLCGRHVHRGKVVAVQTCCEKEPRP